VGSARTARPSLRPARSSVAQCRRPRRRQPARLFAQCRPRRPASKPRVSSRRALVVTWRGVRKAQRAGEVMGRVGSRYARAVRGGARVRRVRRQAMIMEAQGGESQAGGEGQVRRRRPHSQQFMSCPVRRRRHRRPAARAPACRRCRPEGGGSPAQRCGRRHPAGTVVE